MRSRSTSFKSAVLFVFILPTSVGVRPVRFRVVRFLALVTGGFGVEFAAFLLVVTKTASLSPYV